MDIDQALKLAEKQLAMTSRIQADHADFVARMVQKGLIPEVLDTSAYDECLALLGEFLDKENDV